MHGAPCLWRPPSPGLYVANPPPPPPNPASSDLYYVVTATELHGDQYLFPIVPKATQLRKNLLKRLSALVELRQKDERREAFLQLAADVDSRIAAVKRELDLVQVGRTI